MTDRQELIYAKWIVGMDDVWLRNHFNVTQEEIDSMTKLEIEEVANDL